MLGRTLCGPDKDLLVQYIDLVKRESFVSRLDLEVNDVLVHHSLTIHSAETPIVRILLARRLQVSCWMPAQLNTRAMAEAPSRANIQSLL